MPVSAAVSAALAGLWLHALSQPAPEVTSEYRLGVWVTAAMVVLETAAQPLVILAQAMLFVKLKVNDGGGVTQRRGTGCQGKIFEARRFPDDSAISVKLYPKLKSPAVTVVCGSSIVHTALKYCILPTLLAYVDYL